MDSFLLNLPYRLIDVVGGSSEPPAAPDGAVWVKTAVPITSWAIAPDPSQLTPEEGMVVIGTDLPAVWKQLTSLLPMVSPVGGAFLYSGGSWAAVSAAIRDNGAWTSLDSFKFFAEGSYNSGNLLNAAGDLAIPSIKGKNIYLSTKSNDYGVAYSGFFNLSRIKRIEVSFVKGGESYDEVGVTSLIAITSGPPTFDVTAGDISNIVAKQDARAKIAKGGIVVLNVEAVSGNHNLCIAIGGSSSFTEGIGHATINSIIFYRV